MSGAERREEITAEIAERTGITEAMIERLVRGFYEKVRADEMLAPVFEARIRDWEPHLQRSLRFGHLSR
jgi:hemoglobin